VAETLWVASLVLTSANTSVDIIRYVDRSRQDINLLAGLQTLVIVPFNSDREADLFADLTVRLRKIN